MGLKNLKRVNKLEDVEIKKIVRKRAEDKLGFYWHFAIYLVINFFLLLFCFSQEEVLSGLSFHSLDGV